MNFNDFLNIMTEHFIFRHENSCLDDLKKNEYFSATFLNTKIFIHDIFNDYYEKIRKEETHLINQGVTSKNEPTASKQDFLISAHVDTIIQEQNSINSYFELTIKNKNYQLHFSFHYLFSKTLEDVLTKCYGFISLNNTTNRNRNSYHKIKIESINNKPTVLQFDQFTAQLENHKINITIPETISDAFLETLTKPQLLQLFTYGKLNKEEIELLNLSEESDLDRYIFNPSHDLSLLNYNKQNTSSLKI